MGLDMFAKVYAATTVPVGETDVEFGDLKSDDLWYWRKHHDLHGWMSLLYKEKGGTDPEFNCANLRLNKEDLDRLQKDVEENNLPQTSGFFFGNNSPDEESKNDDLEFIKKAKEAIENGQAVYYDSWW